MSVAYATTAGTATAGTDFVAKSGTLTIPAGATVGVIAVDVKGDRQVEPEETFTVKLTEPQGATLRRATGTGTIVSDDAPTEPAVRVSIGNASVVEGDFGARALRFPVTLSASSPTPVTVQYTTARDRGRRRLRGQVGHGDHPGAGDVRGDQHLGPAGLRPRAHRDVHREAVGSDRGDAQPGTGTGSILDDGLISGMIWG